MKGLLPIQLDIIKFKDKNELLEFQEINPWIKVTPDKLLIRYNEIQRLDIFKIDVMNFDWIISERLAQALEMEHLTGYVKKEIDWLIDE